VSQKASGYERIEGDAYFTPHWVTEALLSVETFSVGAKIIDPCAGAGHIMDAAAKAGYETDGFDIRPAAVHVRGPLDFLTVVGDIDAIISNPPYGKGGRLAVEFINKALSVTQKRRGKVAMLLRVDFDSARTRSHIFGDHPAFAAKYTLTKRIRWTNIPQVDENCKPTPGPTDNHAWFVWDWSKRRDTPRAYGYLP
jgi:predicted RNA methylase